MAEQTAPTPNAPDREPLNRSRRAHQQVMRWRVVAPLAAVFGLLVGIPLAFTIFAGGGRANTAASLMSLCISLPLSLVCLIGYAAFIAAIFGVAKVYGSTSAVVRRAHHFAHRVNLGTKSIARRVGRPLISLNARYTYIEQYIQHTVGGLLPAGEEGDERER